VTRIARRTVLKASAAVAAPWLVRARAQTRARRIGVLYAIPSSLLDLQAANETWQKRGWIVGETLLIERRFAAWRMERMPELVDELLRHQGVEVLMTEGPEATVAAARTTRTVPIVFVNVFTPIESGLIDSYARPGRNCTGLTWSPGLEVLAKRIELLRTIAPSARRLAYLLTDPEQVTLSGKPLDLAWRNAADAAKAHGFEHSVHIARRIEDVDTALAEGAAARAQAVHVTGPSYIAVSARVADFALRQRWVTSTPHRLLFDAGLVLCLDPSDSAYNYMRTRWGDMADRILRGANPAEMPVELPTQYALSLNLKTARALGLTLPQSLLLRADRVVE
jgi:putative ABC transport system substrate-binding protein